MKRIQTLLGDIPPEKLGITDAHDHLIRSGGMEVVHDRDFLLDDVDKAVQEMELFLKAGGKTIVDMDPIGCGRNVPKMLEIAKRFAGRGHIILTTGFQRGEFYDHRTHWVATCKVDQIAALLVAEIKEGLDLHSYNGPVVERTTAKAGVIKAGTGYGAITPFEKKVFQAVALAQQETGAPIVTHTQFGTMAMEQIELLREYGANLEKVVLSHVQRNPDLWYHKRLLDTGVSLCYDGLYRVKYFSDNVIANLIHELVRAGYQKQLLLSMDAGRASYQKAYGGGVGIDYMLTVFVPRLRSEGLAESAIEDILIHNPARIFAIDKA
jgi:phosphotriesterase-related protein